MLRILVGLLLACSSAAASAAPISFTTTQFLTSTAALTTTLADADNATSPPTALPLIIDSTVFDANNFASGTAIAGPGFLGTSADVTSTSSFASAVGSAEFIGIFTAPLPFVTVDFPPFTNSNFASGATAFADGALLVRLTSNGSTLYDQLFTTGAPISATIPITPGATAALDILLFSEASVITGGNASNTSFATFSVAAVVPEPHTVALFVLGLFALAWFRRQTLR